MQAPSTDHLFQSDAQLVRAAEREAKALRTAGAGHPARLPSKPLDLHLRANSGEKPGGAAAACAWTAESGFVVRKSDVKTGKTVQSYKGHTGPVTSLAFFSPLAPGPGSGPTSAKDGKQARKEVVFSGSWDKSIRTWDTTSASQVCANEGAHTDFVKCLLAIPSLRVLVSGGSDKDIRIWDLAHLSDNPGAPEKRSAETNGSSSSSTSVSTSTSTSTSSGAGLPFLRSLKSSSRFPHTRPIESLQYCPILTRASVDNNNNSGDDDDDDGEAVESGRHALWAADSMGRVSVWEIWRDGDAKEGGQLGEVHAEFRHTWLAHETAVYEIRMSRLGEAWTASADQLATMWTFDPADPSSPPTATLRLPHPSYVKTVLPLEFLLPGSNAHYVLTGSTDEQIRIWDLSLLDECEIGTRSNSKQTNRQLGRSGTTTTTKTSSSSSAADASDAYRGGKRPQGLVLELEGHFHEVVKLELWAAGTPEETVDLDLNTVQPSALPAAGGAKEKEQEELYLISAGLDCTLRKWKLSELLAQAREKAAALSDEAESAHLTADEEATRKRIARGAENEPKTMAITAEEEAELAELMDDM